MIKEKEILSSYYDSLNLLIEKKPKGRFLMRTFVAETYPELLNEYDDLLEKMKWLIIRRGRGFHYEIEGYCGQVIGKFKQLTTRELSQVCGMGGQSISSAIDVGERRGFSSSILEHLPFLANSESLYRQIFNVLFNVEIDFTN